MFTASLLPGQGFCPLVIWRKSGSIGKTGRPEGKYTPTKGTFLGIVTNASQKEIEQWKQNGHPISHKITSYSAGVAAKATDYLVMDDGRQFYIRGTKNPGDLGLTLIYYVEQRQDIIIGDQQ